MENGRLRAFLKDSLMKELSYFQLEQKPAKKMIGLLPWHSHLKGLADTPRVTVAVTHLIQPHMFFAAVRPWPH
jgi:hypothetical protein